jgi:peroxiredoxin
VQISLKFGGFLLVFSALLLQSCGNANRKNLMGGQKVENENPARMTEAGDPNEDVWASYISNVAPHPGASRHGRVFDYGPRQAPTDHLPDSVSLSSPITSCNAEALKLINIAFSYIHAFELVEAERFFRTAFSKDERCAMALWGAGLTQIIFNSGNPDRGAKFVKLAFALKKNRNIILSETENQLLNMLLGYFQSPRGVDDKKTFVARWVELSKKNPAEIELKALAALFIWNEKLIEKLGYTQDDINKWLTEVFEKYPNHPAHHYRIHLWNDQKHESNALESAEKIGPSFVNSAHMWHMGSHIYFPLGQMLNANEQFQRAAFLDQSYQQTILEFPYMLHNYVHNQDYWLANLGVLGSYRKFGEVIKGLLKLPWHLSHNNPTENSSEYESAYQQGITDLNYLAEAYGAYRVVADCEKYIIKDSAKIKNKQGLLKLYFNLAWSFTALGDNSKVDEYKSLIRTLGNNSQLSEAAAKYLDGLALFEKWTGGEHLEEIANSMASLTIAGNSILSNSARAKFYRLSGAHEKAFNTLRALENGSFTSVNDFVELAHAQAKLGDKEYAQKLFTKAQKNSALVDSDSELYALGSEVSALLGNQPGADWRLPYTPRDLALKLPAGATGAEYTPPLAPEFALQNGGGKNISLRHLLNNSNKGIVLVFVLGGSCARCNEALRNLNGFKEKFARLGYDVVAVTTDSAEDIKTINDLVPDDDGLLKFPLLSDDKMETFKKYRSYDDFESLPLHGTYLINKEDARIHFLDRGALPLKNMDFLLGEIVRQNNYSQ